ncbi:hypothetical protein thsrh120_61660 [Rhizobium sp. No.120]
MRDANPPIAAYVGDTAIKRLPKPISTMLVNSTDLRPRRSARAPKTIPPSGREMKPTAKIAKVLNKAETGSWVSNIALAM